MTMSTSAAASGQRRRGGVGVLDELNDLVSAEGGEGVQAVEVAAGTHDATGTEPLGDLHRHRPGVPCRSQHQHALSDLDRHPATESHPRRHGRVHGCGDLLDIGIVREGDGAPHVDDCFLRHRAGKLIVGDEVDPAPVSQTSDSIDAGDHGQLAGAGVVPAGGPGADPGVEPDGENVDQPLVLPDRRGHVELSIVRWLVEGRDHRGMHPLHGTASCSLVRGIR